MSDPFIPLTLFCLAGVLFAAWKGGPAERLGAAVVVLNIIIGFASYRLTPEWVGIIRFFNDGLAAVVMLGVTVIYGALWMGGVMLFYAAQFSLHAYYFVTDRPDSDRLHAIINNVDFSGIVWCLIIGAAVAWRRRVRIARAAAKTEA
ncbi:hypothetical protein [Phenylobacterium sp.]|jgi:hypothetical protein|uniref:hypothetical protein n=1 Tax=Phenylobacterium sp. TaxID=1871053 RepID=UPI002F426BC4